MLIVRDLDEDAIVGSDWFERARYHVTDINWRILARTPIEQMIQFLCIRGQQYVIELGRLTYEEHGGVELLLTADEVIAGWIDLSARYARQRFRKASYLNFLVEIS